MRICGRDIDDYIPASDPASRRYRPREQCSRCKGDGVISCQECYGAGTELVDGVAMKCEFCEDGLRKCFECDGSGREI